MRSAHAIRRAMVAGMITMAGSSAAWGDEGEVGGFFSDLFARTTFVGTVRSDTAVRTTGLQNFYDQGNMPYQHTAVPRQAYLPPSLGSALLGTQVLPAATNWNIPIPNIGLHTNDTVRRDTYIKSDDVKVNYQELRFSGEMNMAFTDNLRFNVQARAVFDPDISNQFDARSLINTQGGIPGGGADRYADTGRPNYFEARGRNGRNLNPTEFAGRKYMVDFPTALLEYKHDAFNLRLGIQQIAWGQAIFFQTFDVPNGLDFRRHLVLDRAIEEFSDKRVPALALRGAWQATDEMLIDSYISKFQPSIIPNPNTPFNVAPAQFYKPLDNYFTGGYNNKLNFGIRMKSDYGNWGYSAMAASRYNPLGVFSWSESGINRGLHGTNADGSTWGNSLGTLVQTAYAAKAPVGGTLCPVYNPTTCRMYDSLGEALSHTPLTIAPAGVYSNKEWFTSAGLIRLDAVKMLNTVIQEYPALRDVYASEVSGIEEASNLLNTFFAASDGSIRGTIQRDYYRESVFGLGGSYVMETEDPGSFWNQFIINAEAQYTPNRRLTGTDLGHGGEKTNEYILTLVGEKWFRYTESFPAAYLAFEFQHRSATDLVGLNLNGYGGLMRSQPVEDPIGLQGNDYSHLKVAKGISSADYLAFAGFQPWPNRKYVFEWAVLWDVRGGVLAQPLVKWNPGHNVSVDFFYNYLNGHLYGNEGNNLIRVIDWADEFNIRIGYQF
ncbi:hypothetical protein SAMN04488038_102130 [Solimonas aquatica]|uniref:Uncharacterized protein n=1 Tax=Solimonas aquatica TaxID=489703 RepID=A0A1H9BKJ3_9GAMM|nr:DUF1302 family protein [Solimonas aquatica]SEP89510.1 hypothetical protein SAMN04488038_102130 [Solimonas aquatica]